MELTEEAIAQALRLGEDSDRNACIEKRGPALMATLRMQPKP
jgi:hypothetical protein